MCTCAPHARALRPPRHPNCALCALLHRPTTRRTPSATQRYRTVPSYMPQERPHASALGTLVTYVRTCMHTCVCMRACVRVCVRASLCACVRACTACAHVCCDLCFSAACAVRQKSHKYWNNGESLSKISHTNLSQSVSFTQLPSKFRRCNACTRETVSRAAEAGCATWVYFAFFFRLVY